MGTTEEIVKRTARVLIGFMSQGEAGRFAAGGLVLDPQAFMGCWQRMTDSLNLPVGYSPPRVEAMPVAAIGHTTAVCSNPMFAKTYPNSELKMFELGKLIACQWWADTDASGGVHGAGLQGAPSEQEVLTRCLPLTISSPLHAFTLRASPNDLRLYSMNNTFSVEGPSDPDTMGRITFAIGTAPNLMLVREHNGRYVLTNGYHRAWFLRSRGVEMVPAVLVPAPTQQDVVPAPDFIQAHVLFGPRPPLVDDFFDDTLSAFIDVRSMMRAVRISAEALFVPRLL